MSTNLAGKFCPRPFAVAEISANGAVRCCPATWQNAILGNINQQPLYEAWNSSAAQAVRQSVLDGNYRQCDRLGCPRLQSGGIGLLDRGNVTDPYLRRILDLGLTSLPLGPRDVIVNCDANVVATQLHGRVLTNSLEDSRYVTMSNECEPLESDVYLAAMREFDWAKYLSLKINLVTNAIHLTPSTWASISNCHHVIASVNIKLNAANARTFRRETGAYSFGALLHNLSFVTQLRRGFQVGWLTFNFDVTRHNFREMPAYVELALAYGADAIHFTHERPMRGIVPLEVARNAMHQPTHPFHDEFVSVVNHPVLRDPRVNLGCLEEHVGRVASPADEMLGRLLRKSASRAHRAACLLFALIYVNN